MRAALGVLRRLRLALRFILVVGLFEVEFDATARAKRVVVELGLVYPEERWQMDRVLGAAALTYVAAAIQTGMQILYFLWRAGLLDALLGGRRRRDDY